MSFHHDHQQQQQQQPEQSTSGGGGGGKATSRSNSASPTTPPLPSSSTSAIPAALQHSPSPPPMRRTSSHSSSSTHSHQSSHRHQQQRRHQSSSTTMTSSFVPNASSISAVCSNTAAHHTSDPSDDLATASASIPKVAAAPMIRRTSAGLNDSSQAQHPPKRLKSQGVAGRLSGGGGVAAAAAATSSSIKPPSSPDSSLTEAQVKKEHIRQVSSGGGVLAVNIEEGYVLIWDALSIKTTLLPSSSHKASPLGSNTQLSKSKEDGQSIHCLKWRTSTGEQARAATPRQLPQYPDPQIARLPPQDYVQSLPRHQHRCPITSLRPAKMKTSLDLCLIPNGSASPLPPRHPDTFS